MKNTKNLITLLSLTLSAALVSAETGTFTVEGMHCSGCRKTIEAKVCGDAAVKATAEKCEVKLTDEKKQIGTITITTKPDTKIDVETVKKQLKVAGDDYKLAQVDIQDIVKKELTADAATAPAPGTTVTTTTTTETTTTDAATGATTKEVQKTKKTVRTAPAKSTKKTQ